MAAKELPQDQRRRTLFFIVIILCLLILLGVSLSQNKRSDSAAVTPSAPAASRLGDSIVARVNGGPIYESDVRDLGRSQGFEGAALANTAENTTFQTLLGELIDQRLLAQEALKRSLDQQNLAKRRLAMAKEKILGNILIEDHLKQTVTETAVQQMFTAQAALRDRGPQVRARLIVVPDEVSAQQIITRLDKGESFQTLALAYSTDRASRDKAGDLGYFTSDMLDPVLTQKAFEAAAGDRVGPFKTDDGWNIIEVLGSRSAPKIPLEDVRDEIKTFMTYDEIQKLLSTLRQNAAIETMPLQPEPQKEPQKQNETK